MSSRKAGNGSTIMPRIMSIRSGPARFLAFTPLKKEERLAIAFMS
jgi:hypothetical protein